MKKQNGFIATSLLYTFFLAFIGLFMGMIAIYLQNRVYLIKLEDSSKNTIYIQEIQNKINQTGNVATNIKYINGTTKDSVILKNYNENIFEDESSNEYNLAKCETIYYENDTYYIEGCPIS